LDENKSIVSKVLKEEFKKLNVNQTFYDVNHKFKDINN
jgi:hypothetical protein